LDPSAAEARSLVFDSCTLGVELHQTILHLGSKSFAIAFQPFLPHTHRGLAPHDFLRANVKLGASLCKMCIKIVWRCCIHG
jgi:hypothetical protein